MELTAFSLGLCFRTSAESGSSCSTQTQAIKLERQEKLERRRLMLIKTYNDGNSFTSIPSSAETQASDASHMAVRS